ncbi:hypothetical protein SRABI76_03151 [Microbacterium oxydans]|nr:hypothetical protein SRABI76_03151 [Microbacterium oxydans]
MRALRQAQGSRLWRWAGALRQAQGPRLWRRARALRQTQGPSFLRRAGALRQAQGPRFLRLSRMLSLSRSGSLSLSKRPTPRPPPFAAASRACPVASPGRLLRRPPLACVPLRHPLRSKHPLAMLRPRQRRRSPPHPRQRLPMLRRHPPRHLQTRWFGAAFLVSSVENRGRRPALLRWSALRQAQGPRMRIQGPRLWMQALRQAQGPNLRMQGSRLRMQGRRSRSPRGASTSRWRGRAPSGTAGRRVSSPRRRHPLVVVRPGRRRSPG